MENSPPARHPRCDIPATLWGMLLPIGCDDLTLAFKRTAVKGGFAETHRPVPVVPGDQPVRLATIRVCRWIR